MNLYNKMRSKIARTYIERLYTVQIKRSKKVTAKIKIDFIEITSENFYLVKELRSNFYLKDFRKMLNSGDYGLFAMVDGKPIGYGWAKSANSPDYFFKINECYLCRFFVSSSYRGNNIYPVLIQEIMLRMNKNQNTKKFYIAVESTNYASIKGIIKVGFDFIEEITFVRILKITLNKRNLNQY